MWRPRESTWSPKGSSSSATWSTQASATWRSWRIQMETGSCSTTGTRRMRTELLERYRALPLPTTTEESWRFTDLKGFDPDSFTANGAGPAPAAMLDIEVSGMATVSSEGIEISRVPEGITFEQLDEDHPRLGEL